MSKIVLSFVVTIYLSLQTYCFVSNKYLWPLTPLSMFARLKPAGDNYYLIYLDKNNQTIIPDWSVLYPFGPVRTYYFTQNYFNTENASAKKFLEMQKQRIQLFKKKFENHSDRLDSVQKINLFLNGRQKIDEITVE